MRIISFAFASVFLLASLSCVTQKKAQDGLPPYVPQSKELYDTVSRLDSLFFEAYNTCKLDVMANLISEDVEFYHDRGGLSTSKAGLIEALKNNICGKVTRELLRGSIEVYPIPGYGAVEMGAHRFHNKQEPNAPSHYSKFVHTWHREKDGWRLARVISLH